MRDIVSEMSARSWSNEEGENGRDNFESPHGDSS